MNKAIPFVGSILFGCALLVVSPASRAGVAEGSENNTKNGKNALQNNTTDLLKEVRAHTLAELGKRDDAWLMQVVPNSGPAPMNNYCAWFHVCEHESNHNGQVKWLKARLPA